MKNILLLILSSASISIINLLILSIIFSKVNLVDLDTYLIYKDISESILKLLFISQIGSILISTASFSKGNLLILRRVILFGVLIVFFCLFIWAGVFHHFVDYFLPSKKVIRATMFGYLENFIALYAVLLWVDTACSSLLVNLRKFTINNYGNLIGSLVTLISVSYDKYLTIENIAFYFFLGKLITLLPKVLFLFNPVICKPDSITESDVMLFALKNTRHFIPVNVLQQVNRFSYLSGVSYLQPGAFALFNIYNRYYHALQNLFTMNLLHDHTSFISNENVSRIVINRLLLKHLYSFIILLIVISTFYLIINLDILNLELPQFITSGISPALWIFILISFLSDGINLIISNANIFHGKSSWDSKVSIFQVVANTAVLYPAMRYFGVYGLALGTLFVVLIFAWIRCINFSKTSALPKNFIINIILYQLILVLSVLLFINCSTYLLCLVMILISSLILAHAIYNYRFM